ncbi:MAG: hypothetical protein JOZ41_09690 [Chloroflexi bacterium]|nr:hypothetical protein [Chloroflexota bacterium]
MVVRYNAHAMGRFGIALFLLAAVFGGYSAYRHGTSPLMSAQAVADDVGRVYHDAHPDILPSHSAHRSWFADVVPLARREG